MKDAKKFNVCIYVNICGMCLNDYKISTQIHKIAKKETKEFKMHPK